MAYLITHVRIFDGERVTLEDAHVLIENGRIASISSNIPPILPEGCVQIPGSGCTLLPGLIDSHVHVYNDATFLRNALRFGVTTVLDMHNEPHWFQEMKQMAVARNDVADILSACYAATVKGGWPAAIIQLTADSPQVRQQGAIPSINEL
jgi:dihydroorotase-like cyclic amidohydrolase